MKPVKDPTTGHYSVRWRVVRGGTEKRHRATFRTRKEAQAHIEKLATERNKNSDAARRTFNDYADAYLTRAATRGRKARTVGGYGDALKHARAFLGDRKVGTITGSDAAAFLDYLHARPELRTGRSIRWAWQPFAAVLKIAAQDDALPSNPADKVDGLPSTTASDFEPRFLRPQEVARLAQVLDGRAPYGLMVRFLAYTGLRASELAGLEVGHVTTWRTAGGWRGNVRVEQTKRLVSGEWITDTPKSKRSTRDVPMPPWLAEQMAGYLAAHPRADDPAAPLWPNRQRGGFHRAGGRSAPNAEGTAHGEVTYNSPIEPSAFYRTIFKPATQAAGLGAVRLHDLRHSYASILAAQGTPVERVSAWMGHASIVVTWSIYTHLFRGDDDHAAIASISEPVAPVNVTPLRTTG